MTHIVTYRCQLKGLLNKILQQLFLLVTGAAEPNDFADFCWFLQKTRWDHNCSEPTSQSETQGRAECAGMTRCNTLMKHPSTYYCSGEEGDGQWEHLLQLCFADSSSLSRQVAAQLLKTIHDLFLKQYHALAELAVGDNYKSKPSFWTHAVAKLQSDIQRLEGQLNFKELVQHVSVILC